MIKISNGLNHLIILILPCSLLVLSVLVEQQRIRNDYEASLIVWDLTNYQI